MIEKIAKHVFTYKGERLTSMVQKRREAEDARIKRDLETLAGLVPRIMERHGEALERAGLLEVVIGACAATLKVPYEDRHLLVQMVSSWVDIGNGSTVGFETFMTFLRQIASHLSALCQTSEVYEATLIIADVLRDGAAALKGHVDLLRKYRAAGWAATEEAADS